MAKVDWKASEYEARAGLEVVPKGRYLVNIDSVDMEDTKDKKGQYLEVEATILRPEQYKNRKLWARLNVHNKSETAQRIGREQYNALCEAAGIDYAKQKDTDALQNKTVVFLVSIEEGQKGEQNRVNGFMKPAAGAGVEEKKPAASKKPPAANIDDDDIPF